MLPELTSLRNQVPAIDGEDRCRVCSRPNRCRIAAGHADKGECWCNGSSVPFHVQQFVAEKLGRTCLCQRCLDGLAYYAQYLPKPDKFLDLLYEEIKKDSTTPDFYHDQEGRTVFTAVYHLRHGHCCENDCRHCPYSFSR